MILGFLVIIAILLFGNIGIGLEFPFSSKFMYFLILISTFRGGVLTLTYWLHGTQKLFLIHFCISFLLEKDLKYH